MVLLGKKVCVAMPAWPTQAMYVWENEQGCANQKTHISTSSCILMWCGPIAYKDLCLLKRSHSFDRMTEVIAF